MKTGSKIIDEIVTTITVKYPEHQQYAIRDESPISRMLHLIYDMCSENHKNVIDNFWQTESGKSYQKAISKKYNMSVREFAKIDTNLLSVEDQIVEGILDYLTGIKFITYVYV